MTDAVTPRSLGFRTDVRLLELAGSSIEDGGDHIVVRSPANPDHHWGNFILLREPPKAGRAREAVGSFLRAFASADTVRIGVDEPGGPGRQLAPLREMGLSISSSAVMTTSSLRPLSLIRPDAEVRPLLTEDDWKLYVRLSCATNPSIPEGAYLDFILGKAAQERDLVSRGLGERFGAFVSDQLVSTAAIFSLGPDVARYQNVETHPAFRRQGLAAAVVSAAGTHALAEYGCQHLVIVAEPEGPAIGIYRRLGFVPTEWQHSAEGPRVRP